MKPVMTGALLRTGAILLAAIACQRVEAQQTTGGLQRCLQAAAAQKRGTIAKMEVETAESSDEPQAPQKGASLLEIEVHGSDGSEWELTCDERTGKVIETEQEVPGASHERFKGKAKVSEEEARKTALEAHDGEIVETEYEIEPNGAATYEFDVKPTSGTGEMKIEVDATTGKIVERRRELYQIGAEPDETER